jgi:hypothetical protein
MGHGYGGLGCDDANAKHSKITLHCLIQEFSGLRIHFHLQTTSPEFLVVFL